jgi:hypothetical protein
MQIRLSWQLLAAILIFIIALLIIGRSLAGRNSRGAADATAASLETTPAEAASPVAPTPTLPTIPTATATAPAPSPTGAATSQLTATPSATATSPPPTASATPAPATVVIVAQGFGQREEQVTYGFIVANPNEHVIARDVRYQAIIYDQNGLVIGADTGSIAVIGAAQQTGAVGSVTLPDAALQAARSEIVLGGGQFLQAVPLPPFPVENISLLPGEEPVVTALVGNPYAQELSDLAVVALIFDGSNRVVGGGAGAIPFLPGNGQAAITIPVAYNGDGIGVAIYPRLPTLLAP